MKQEFFPHELINGGLQRRSQITTVSDFETKVVIERWPDGRLVLAERDVSGRSCFGASISLSDMEARVVIAEMTRALNEAANPQKHPADVEAEVVTRLEGIRPVLTRMSDASSDEDPTRTAGAR